ncbi:glycosyltransferase family 2 protein [Roseimicrobium sp. ORNL1]|uniref:glycosyltransferase family 2 protein n=1 Tax=Roseimicrobium sp. ORNL1 TaxID=2711231 RepID=UPI0013E1850C|nr:glycosyltransferase family 2 protein [Roseimicrobium sp. ORNL1]QIF01271.1 glycosyltransferase family 2 protein [Roseimicrobium sp. ORNL1]
MLQGKKIAVTMPAYFAEKTVAKTVGDIPREFVDTIILVDDCSKDNTVAAAQALGIEVHRNETNQNYGGNVKRCLQYALDAGADIVIQLHPDYQYTPKLTLAMASMLATEHWDLCLGVRTSGKGAKGTMPFWRYLPNRVITAAMDVCLGVTHSEFHTGYRAYTRKLLETVPFHTYRNDFIFDNQMFIGALRAGFDTCEVTCPTSYEEDASSIPFKKALKYGVQCLKISVPYFFERLGKKDDAS